MIDLFGGADPKQIRWADTVKLNTMRAAGAGIVWGTLLLFVTRGQPSDGAGPAWWTLPLLLPVGYVFVAAFLLTGAKIAHAMGSDLGKQIVGFGVLAFSLMVIAGDPLVYALYRTRPRWVPVATFAPVNFVLVLYVLEPRNANG